MEAAPLIRVLFWLPLIFLVSYMLVGAVFALIAVFWIWILAAVALVVALVLLAAHVS